jgi:hypothetical protein
MWDQIFDRLGLGMKTFDWILACEGLGFGLALDLAQIERFGRFE